MPASLPSPLAFGQSHGRLNLATWPGWIPFLCPPPHCSPTPRHPLWVLAQELCHRVAQAGSWLAGRPAAGCQALQHQWLRLLSGHWRGMRAHPGDCWLWGRGGLPGRPAGVRGSGATSCLTAPRSSQEWAWGPAETPHKPLLYEWPLNELPSPLGLKESASPGLQNTKGNSSSLDRSSGEHRRKGTPLFPALNRFLFLAECVCFTIVNGKNTGLGVDTTWGPTPAQPFSHYVALGQWPSLSELSFRTFNTGRWRLSWCHEN